MLDAVDLTPAEEKVYLTLLDLGAASAADLADRHSDGGVDAVLAALERKALISRVAGRPPRYKAEPPDVALDLLVREKEQELARARLTISALTDRYRISRLASRPEEVIDVVTTREGTIHRWEQLQHSARVQVRSFDRPPYVTDPTANPIEIERLRDNVVYRSVYHVAGFDLPGRPKALRTLIAEGEQARVAAAVPVKLFIADDHIALLPLELDGSAESSLVIHASSLLDTLIALFENVWTQAVAVHPDGSAPDLRGGPQGDDVTLLGLLAGGLTDHAIARHLGSHPRTVQRRVRDLLDRLGATTRFQAGLQAARRGWL